MREERNMAALMYKACQAGGMSPEKERAMLRAIQDGREAKHRLDQGGTEPENAAFLKEAVRYGMECRTQLATAYLPTLVLIARRYSYSSVPMEDLIQEGTVGMLEAIDSLEKEGASNMAAIIHVKIREALQRLINQQRVVRLPRPIAAAVRKVNSVSKSIQQNTGVEPQAEVIAKEMVIPPAITRQLLSYNQVTAALSLDAPVGDEEGSALFADLFAADETTPEDIIERESLREQILEILETLEPIEASTIKLRFGFVGEALSAELTAEELKVPLDLEQMAEIRALRKLRHPSRSKFLEDYLYD